MPKIGPVKPNEGRGFGQKKFLHAVEKYVPEVLSELKKLGPLYETIPPEIFEQTSRGPLFVRPNLIEVSFFGAQPQLEYSQLSDLLYWKNIEHFLDQFEVRQLRDAVLGWALKFNLTDEWVLDRAMQTLYRWRKTPETENAWGSFPIFAGDGLIIEATERLFDFQHEGWGVEFEPWDEFLQRFQSDLDKKLDVYRQRVLNIAQTRGWTQRPNILYKPGHFQWLAVFQTRGKSPAEVLEDTNMREMDPSTALKAIQNVADAIGLTLRKPRKGRKPKPVKPKRRKT